VILRFYPPKGISHVWKSIPSPLMCIPRHESSIQRGPFWCKLTISFRIPPRDSTSKIVHDFVRVVRNLQKKKKTLARTNPSSQALLR
jgi:hypothetical protein